MKNVKQTQQQSYTITVIVSPQVNTFPFFNLGISGQFKMLGVSNNKRREFLTMVYINLHGITITSTSRNIYEFHISRFGMCSWSEVNAG